MPCWARAQPFISATWAQWAGILFWTTDHAGRYRDPAAAGLKMSLVPLLGTRPNWGNCQLFAPAAGQNLRRKPGDGRKLASL